ncbi:MAG: hypothetical protein NT123_05380 [Proteobacteria bacterium]|nr:hypothetical protein [Pseudomonadota bacterium]
MIAGTLEIQMLANMARLAEDMGKAKNIVGDAVGKIEKVLGALGVGFGASELLEKINTVAEGMDKLMTASEKTGASVEALSKLQFFAGVSGSNIDSVTGALVKLAKGESEAGNETGKFTQALKVLNLSAKDSAGELKDPSVLYGEIAQKLFGYADGAGKTAIAVALMGKSGAEQLPTMKKIVELGDIEASVTREQAAAAEEYGIEMAKLARQKEILWQTITSALLPSMQTFVGVLIDAGKQSDSLGGKAKQLAGDGSIESWADASAMGIARFIDVLKAALQLLSATIASAKVVANDLEKPAKHLALIAAWATPGSGVTKEQGDQMWKEQLDEYAKDLADANQKYANLYDADKTAFSRAVGKVRRLRSHSSNSTWSIPNSPLLS